MPGFDKSGPLGKGQMTGRRMGRCTNYGAAVNRQTNENVNETETGNSAFFMGSGNGMGMGNRNRGRGFGRGRQNRFRGGF